MKKANITDITLKTLAQDREVSLLFREKTAIAVCADSLGVNAVELAPIKNLREDTIIYKTIAQNVQNSTLAIPVGFSAEEVAQAWECVKDAKQPRLQIEVPTSTVQMEYTYHVKQSVMLEKITQLIKAAREVCDDVEFSALDATRADEEFLIAAACEAEKNGAGIITVCDNAGASVPEEIALLVAKKRLTFDELFDSFSLFIGFELFSLGLFEVRSLVLYASLTVLFLFLSALSLRKWRRS